MKPLDKQFLSLQFRNKILLKNGTEFQSFFENIMEKVFSDFRKIRPYGNMGDGGNDGYRKEAGIYYQVYAPRVPKISEKDAADKLVEDFQKLKNEWDQIANIKEYTFVYNDKYDGSVQLLEEAVASLHATNPSIDFKLYLAKDLERDFVQLNDSDILDLGFNVDRRQVVEIAFDFLENVKKEFDRENVLVAQRILEYSKDSILGLVNDELLLEYEILESFCLQKLERVDEAREKYENISKRYPEDPRPFLYLAEICLSEYDYDKNKEFLEKAESIDSDFWLLKLEKILRKQNLGEGIDINAIDEKTYPDNPRLKANFYRLYGLLLENSGDQINADRFFAKAIHLNPDRFSTHLDELSLVERRMLASADISQRLHLSQMLLDGIERVTNKFAQYGDIGARNKMSLYAKKFGASLVQDDIPGLESTAKAIFSLTMSCYFNRQIEQTIARVFKLISLPDYELNQLLEYVKRSNKKISPELASTIIFQFNIRGKLIADGKNFFKEIGDKKYSEFIENLENDNHQYVLDFLQHDVALALMLASTPIRPAELRRKIIESLPDDKNIQKEKLTLLLNYDEADFDEAFQILQQLDLSELDYFECRLILQVARQKKAWDFEIIILEKLLEKEKSERIVFNLKLQLFNAYLSSKNFLAAIDIGEQLLKEDVAENFYNPRRQDALLSNTIYACLERGKVDNTAISRAKSILDFYQLANPSLEFKAGYEAEVYISSNEAKNALNAVIDGVKIKKLLSSHEYAKLYFLFVRIGNQIEDLNTESLNEVQDDTFVKLIDKDQWYFIGDKNELDATPVSKTNSKYSLFIDKKLGDNVVFENKYGSKNFESEIQLIFTTEKYILWQVVQNFQMLAKEGDLDGVQMIEIPQKEETIDPKYILKFMEDLNKRSESLFDLYCQNNVPLSVLAVSEGGLVGAIGRIQNEGKGYINYSAGPLDELEKQKEVARRVIEESKQFYIDGTSALVLSEIGLLQKIYVHLPNLKVSQSVINMLVEIANRFRYIPGETGDTMGYSKGKITFSSIGPDKRDLLRANFQSSIKLLESNPKNINVISSANKVDCFSETQIPAELCDACILAQKANISILTEDYLYLKLNESETKKEAPEYFSSWALVRVLYEKGYVTFDEYLEYFGYLSSYRFRFLSLNPDDIQKAVFGDGGQKINEPKNIRKMNFPLVLSEEYGVAFDDALRVIGIFFFRAMMDDTVRLDVLDEIFVEIIESFPTKMSKKEFGERLLGICITVFENNTPEHFCRLEDKLRYQKIERLLQAAETLNAEARMATPNE